MELKKTTKKTAVKKTAVKKKGAVKKGTAKKSTTKKSTTKKGAVGKVSEKEAAIRKIAELADSIGMSVVRLPSKITVVDDAETDSQERRTYVKRCDREVNVSAMAAAEKAIVEEHKKLYDMMVSCTDLDEFNRIYKRYAELDLKVARITNSDTAAFDRCVYESSYEVLK